MESVEEEKIFLMTKTLIERTKKIVKIFLFSLLSFTILNIALPGDIFSVKSSYGAWFFFKKEEPIEENFARIQLPLKSLNKLGSLKSGSRTKALASEIESVNEKLDVRIVAIGNMVQIVFNYKDTPREKRKLMANKISLYRLALTKPEENYGRIIDDIASSNKHIDFLEFDREEKNVFFQWPLIDETKKEEQTGKPPEPTKKIDKEETPVITSTPSASPTKVTQLTQVDPPTPSDPSPTTMVASVAPVHVPVPEPSIAATAGVTSGVVLSAAGTAAGTVLDAPRAVAGAFSGTPSTKVVVKKDKKGYALYEKEHEKTLMLQDRIDGINKEFKEKEKTYLKDLEESKDTNSELKESIAQVQVAYNKLLKDNEAIKKEKEEAEGQFKSLIESNKEKHGKAYELEKSYDRKIGTLEREKSDLALKLETSEEKVRELRKERLELSRQATKLEEQIKETDSANEKLLKKELATYDKQIKGLTASRNELQYKLAQYEEKDANKRTGSDITALKQEIQSLKDERDALEKEFEKHKEDTKANLNETVEKFNARINTLESEAENKKEELKAQEAKFNSEIAAFKKKIELLQGKLDSLNTENQKLLSELEGLKSKSATADPSGLVSSLQDDLESKKKELEALKEDYDSFKAQAAKNQAAIEEMLEKEKKKKAELEVKLADVSLEKQRLQKEAESIGEKKEELLAKYKEQEDKLKEELKKASEDEKKTLKEEYERQLKLKKDDFDKLREREKKFQEAEAQLELDLKARLDKERYARMQAEEEVARLKKEREAKAGSVDIEAEKKKIIEDMKREAEQQKRLLELANEEEKKTLKADFKKAQQEKEQQLEDLRDKLKEMSSAKSEAELKAKIEVEMTKKLEDMIKIEIAKGMSTSPTSGAKGAKQPAKDIKKAKDIKETKDAKKPDAKEAVTPDERGIPFDLTLENFFAESGLCSNWITALYEDELELWVGTRDKGVTRYIKAEDNWVCYSRFDGVAGDDISSIVKYDGVMYIATDNGISKFDGISWETIKRHENIVLNNALMRVHDGVMWVAARTLYGGFLTFDGQKWVNMSLMKPGEILNEISCFEFQGDTLWIGTGKSGVYKYDGKTWVTLRVSDGLVSNFIYSIAANGDDVWIGSCCGLVIYNTKTLETTILDKNLGLAHDSVYDIGIDGKVVWFSTKGGISMYDGYDFVNYYKTDGIADDRSLTLLVKPEYVWFGTVGGLVKATKEY
jgi:chromosome segregation ATPase